MNDETTYQVRRYRNGGGIGSQVATGIKTLAEVAEIAFHLAQLQQLHGGCDDFTILPD